MQADLANVYDNLPMPVIVCATADDLSVAYMNAAARLVFAPSLSVAEHRGDSEPESLAKVLRFRDPGAFDDFRRALSENGAVCDFDVAVLSYQGEAITTRLYANIARFFGQDYFVVYVGEPVEASQDVGDARLMTRILRVGHYTSNINQAIETILRLAGEYIHASRAFIFEDISPSTTKNTYEWCAPGVQSFKDALHSLDKSDYMYDAIMAPDGMIITNDTNQLPESDRCILQDQGIKSVAILPMFHYDTPLGFVGFDDCGKNRNWSMREIQLLKDVAAVLASLVNRRDVERQSRRGREIFRTVADNLNELVYISDLESNELKFVSRSLARAMGRKVEDMIGKPCWSVLHQGQAGPCPFCPLPRIRDMEPDGESYVWELHNSVSGKWYMVKDSVIDWLDGERAHLGTLVDITYRKQYEEQLRRFAATDAMTDVYNRKWGYGKMEELFHKSEEIKREQTLCFVDIDGLKKVNDKYGHAAGDEMIVNTIRTIFACIRKNDFITRWGGDEFILLLRCRPEDALGVLTKINFGIEHFNSTSGKPYRLSISAGLVGFSEQYATLDALIAEADARMYANKLKRQELEQQEPSL